MTKGDLILTAWTKASKIFNGSIKSSQPEESVSIPKHLKDATNMRVGNVYTRSNDLIEVCNPFTLDRRCTKEYVIIDIKGDYCQYRYSNDTKYLGKSRQKGSTALFGRGSYLNSELINTFIIDKVFIYNFYGKLETSSTNKTKITQNE